MNMVVVLWTTRLLAGILDLDEVTFVGPQCNCRLISLFPFPSFVSLALPLTLPLNFHDFRD